MSKHQIIYTSCMRGIDGINDGQQIFSYDKGFTDNKSDAIKSLFTYQIPALEPGQTMTEELAKEMPSAFSYRNLEKDRCAITLNTYLGRDYMGSAGRFGNHLSHSIICDYKDLDIYPSEIYGSSCLRDHMNFDEVNNPNPPEYLPVPEIEKGYVSDIDSVIDFLGEGENIDYLKKMVIAMISFAAQKKRVVICDEPQNIARWIAAMQFVLPLDIAKKVNFSTYEYDPELSPAQICGVVSSGTRYNSQTYIQSGHHYVFDFINNIFSEIEDKDEPFIDFIDTSLSFSYDSLTNFFQFVINQTSYRDLDEDYYNCYLLYTLFSDGLSDITEDQFTGLTHFADNHIDAGEKKRLLKILEESIETINGLDNEYALKILSYLLKYEEVLSDEQMNAVKQMAVRRITYTLSDNSTEEDAFYTIYDTVERIARPQGLSIPAELMNDRNRDALLGVISDSTVADWKVYSIVRIVSDYVKDANMPCEELYPDQDTGKLYQEIFTVVNSADKERGNNLIAKILDCFKDDISYLANMTLNIEGYLIDQGNAEKSIEYLWDRYCSYTEVYDKTETEKAVEIFRDCDRFDVVYYIYRSRLLKESQFDKARIIYRNVIDEEFKKYPSLREKYASNIIEEYYNKYDSCLKDLATDDAVNYARELVKDAINNNIKDEYFDVLIGALVDFIPLGKLEKIDAEMISSIADYQHGIRHKNIEGRILLFVIGINFNKILSRRDIRLEISEIRELAGDRPAILREDEKTIEAYYDWILPVFLRFPLEKEDYKAIYDLFNMSIDAKQAFIIYFCRENYEKSKIGYTDITDFSEFLLFVFESGDRKDCDLVGKTLCKLNKQKLAELDERMKEKFKNDRNATQKWESIREIAENTNPLLNNLSGLFKKKRD